MFTLKKLCQQKVLEFQQNAHAIANTIQFMEHYYNNDTVTVI
jgi:hypothetical protein